jgi:uncharacterized protein
MQTHWSDERITYDGSQLRAHWLLDRFGLVGDAAAAFRGPCAVRPDEIADLADVDGPGIAGNDMVHLVWECFTRPELLLAVHRQRLLAAQAADVLRRLGAAGVERSGDDLFVGEGKLSISIATVTPVSALIHFAINATQGGAPVHTASLDELGVAPDVFARELTTTVAAEQASIEHARAKVRAKGEWR